MLPADWPPLAEMPPLRTASGPVVPAAEIAGLLDVLRHEMACLDYEPGAFLGDLPGSATQTLQSPDRF